MGAIARIMITIIGIGTMLPIVLIIFMKPMVSAVYR